jgi:hypothetical protein
MKKILVKEAGKWALRGYIIWSICADLSLLGGLLYLMLKYG